MAAETAVLQPVYVYQGQDQPLNVTMNPVVDVTGWTFSFTIRTEPGDDGTLLIQKTVGSGITLTDPTNGTFQVLLSSANIESLDVGTYYYDVWRIDTGNYYPIIEPSKFKVKAGVYQVGQ